MAAQGGDVLARGRITGDADAYLSEALSMFGRASTDYRAIYDAVRGTVGDFAASGGTDSGTIGDLVGIAQSSAQTAQQQAKELIDEVKALRTELSGVREEVKKTTVATEDNTARLTDAVETGSRETVRIVSTLQPVGRIS